MRSELPLPLADSVTARWCQNDEWRAHQLRELEEDRFSEINETSIGNLLLCHEYGTHDEKRRIEQWLRRFILYKYVGLRTYAHCCCF